jgi:hypothetical protein
MTKPKMSKPNIVMMVECPYCGEEAGFSKVWHSQTYHVHTEEAIIRGIPATLTTAQQNVHVTSFCRNCDEVTTYYDLTLN